MKITVRMLALASLLIGCAGPKENVATPVRGDACPECAQVLSEVPYLVSGPPSTNMMDKVERAEALLAGCVGDPSGAKTASVCLHCRKWKTRSMKYWQPLPKQFGTSPKE
jgi:hypothetical protein